MHRSHRLVACLLAAVGCLILSSCAGFNADTESLMRRPRLTAEQKSIEDALLRSVVASDILFKYPEKGDYRSAFLFQDIDADGQDEALVFYIFGGSSFARLSVLDRNEAGEWEAVCELSGPHENVDFISFAQLSGNAAPDILVGWSNPNSDEKLIEVYAYTAENLVRLMEGAALYDEYLVDDLDQNGTDDLFLFTRNSGTREKSAWIHLMGYDGYRLGIIDELPLSDSITDFAQVITGALNLEDKRRFLFIDEMQAGSNYVTEVFGLQAGDLVPIIGHSVINTPVAATPPAVETPPFPEVTTSEEALPPQGNVPTEVNTPTELADQEFTLQTEEQTNSLYEQTIRASSTALCGDIDGNGSIEIPTGLLLPGYEDMEATEQLFLTAYNRVVNRRFQRVTAAITNFSAGYRIQFPAAWIGNVTVVNQPENNEWRFIEYDEEQANPLEDLSRELLRIRVVSQKDYQDKFLENYTVLGTRGAFTYYAYIPPNAETSLRATIEQLQNELFSLL